MVKWNWKYLMINDIIHYLQQSLYTKGTYNANKYNPINCTIYHNVYYNGCNIGQMSGK